MWEMTFMCATEQLLICVHKTAEMGLLAADKLIETTRDDNFKEKLCDSREVYKRVWMSADMLLKARDGDDSGVSDMAKVMCDMSIDFTALRDDSTDKLLEKLSKGNERGLKELEKAFSECGADADEEVVNLANVLRKLLLKEREDIDAMQGGSENEKFFFGDEPPRERV